jgi:hypothetical protein
LCGIKAVNNGIAGDVLANGHTSKHPHFCHPITLMISSSASGTVKDIGSHIQAPGLELMHQLGDLGYAKTQVP